VGNTLRKTVRRLKRFVAVAKGRDWYPRVESAGPTRRIGSAYGGWTVLTAPLESHCPMVLSFGVGEDITFDLGMIEQFGAKVFAYDPTPRCVEWIGRQSLPPDFMFYPFAVGAKDEVRQFYAPANPAHVSHSVHTIDSGEQAACISVQFKAFATVIEDLNVTDIDVLKMDIEGAEYEVIDALLSSPVRPRQLLIEFHHRSPPLQLRDTKLAVSQLIHAGYRLFHVSETGEEYSFVMRREAVAA
jgi:FkbM family methyltransferase